MFRTRIETELMCRPAPLSELGPYFRPGEVSRLQRRYHREPDPKVFDLSHGLQGKQQMGAILEFLMLEQNQVNELRLGNNGIDDSALETLAKGLCRRGAQVTSLDISQNALTHASINALLPTLKVTPLLKQFLKQESLVLLKYLFASLLLRLHFFQKLEEGLNQRCCLLMDCCRNWCCLETKLETMRFHYSVKHYFHHLLN